MQHSTKQNLRWHYFDTETQMNSEVAVRIAALANTCIAQHNQFSIVLSGGNTPRNLYALLREIKTNWSRWHIYFGDERCLPANTEGRNDQMALDTWLSHVAIPAAQIHNMPSELSPTEAVVRYTQILSSVDLFDLVLLGMGEDGHTASLFPQHDWGAEKNAPPVLAINHAPFPPPQRISLSAQRLSQAQQVWYLISGATKKNALLRWQQGKVLPMSAITPPNGVDVFVAQA
ncbi:MAG: 6-phosphogluconolactonase [Pseudomonadales bacterium]